MDGYDQLNMFGASPVRIRWSIWSRGFGCCVSFTFTGNLHDPPALVGFFWISCGSSKGRVLPAPGPRTMLLPTVPCWLRLGMSRPTQLIRSSWAGTWDDLDLIRGRSAMGPSQWSPSCGLWYILLGMILGIWDITHRAKCSQISRKKCSEWVMRAVEPDHTAKWLHQDGCMFKSGSHDQNESPFMEPQHEHIFPIPPEFLGDELCKGWSNDTCWLRKYTRVSFKPTKSTSLMVQSL